MVRRGSESKQREWSERARGFTLVEMLVVTAVIAILAALLFPVLARARERAWQTTCLSNLHQLSQAHLLYLQDWDERFPNWFYLAPPRPAWFGIYSYWPEFLHPYVRSASLLADPGFSRAEPPIPGRRLSDYALLTWGPNGRGSWDDPYYRWAGPPLSLTQVMRPTETASLMDGYTTTDKSGAVESRHARGVNASFLDGHARWLTPDELWRVDTDGLGKHWFRHATANR